jgi:hypothetical protein
MHRLDLWGLELPDIAAAHRHALTLAREVLPSGPTRALLRQPCWIAVTDAAERPQFVVPVRPHAVERLPRTGSFA